VGFAENVCGHGRPCTPQCSEWGCNNCPPPAPPDIAAGNVNAVGNVNTHSIQKLFKADAGVRYIFVVEATAGGVSSTSVRIVPAGTPEWPGLLASDENTVAAKGVAWTCPATANYAFQVIVRPNERDTDPLFCWPLPFSGEFCI
jgi:hypothetical protein